MGGRGEMGKAGDGIAQPARRGPYSPPMPISSISNSRVLLEGIGSR